MNPGPVLNAGLVLMLAFQSSGGNECEGFYSIKE